MPLFWLSIAFLFGILLGHWSRLPAIAWLIFSGGGFLLFPVFRMTKGIWQGFAGRLRQKTRRSAGILDNTTIRIAQLVSAGSPALRLPALPLLLCCICLGAARYQWAQPAITPEHIAWYNGEKTRMVAKGRLIEPGDERDQFTYLRVKVEQLHPAGELQFRTAQGLLLARVYLGGSWQYGDLVRLEGYLEEPFSNETFSFRDYLAHQGIYSMMGEARGIVLESDQGNPILRAIYAFRESALKRVEAFFPDPEASLLAGILLGVRTGIPEQVDEAFRVTGTSHVIAISGFNITILAGMFTYVFRRLVGRKRGLVLTILVVVFYTILVGASAAVVRAAILAVLGLFGHEVGRRQSGLNSLAIVAAGMAVFQPGVLWDVGFQLSFAATLGLILYADPFMEAFKSVAGKILPPEWVKQMAGAVGAYFLFTLAAQLTTLPLVIHYTGDLSLSALLANPLILPAQPPLMIMGGVATLVGLASVTVGQWLAYLSWPFVAYTIRTVEWLAGMPGGVIPLGGLSWGSLLLFYPVLFGWSFWSWLKAKERAAKKGEAVTGQDEAKPGILVRTMKTLQQRPWLPLLVLLILAAFIWREASSAPDGKLRITILDVGSSEGILIRTPDGHKLMINGGPSSLTLADALGRRLPYRQRQFDWWVIANVDEEAVGSLIAILERYPPNDVLWAGATHGSYQTRQLWEALTDASVPVSVAETGQRLEMEAGITLEVLEANRRGATLLLQWRNFGLLMPSGINFEAMEELKAQARPVSALLLAESGYAPLNTKEWLKSWEPEVVLLSVAADDRQGLPDDEVLEAIEGTPLLRTDVNGWIELITDGEQMWVEVERK